MRVIDIAQRMSKRVTGSFTVKMVPAAAAFPDSGISRMTLDKIYEGPLSATAVGEFLSSGNPKEGEAGYVAIERVTGALEGATGAFTLMHNATMSKVPGAESLLNIVVVPGSGTGALAGLTGKLDIIFKTGAHDYVFDYELPGAAGAAAAQ
jgi:hypothetical protein